MKLRNVPLVMILFMQVLPLACHDSGQSRLRTLESFFESEQNPVCQGFAADGSYDGLLPGDARRYLELWEEKIATGDPDIATLNPEISDLAAEIRATAQNIQRDPSQKPVHHIRNLGRVLGWLSYLFRDQEYGLFRSVEDIYLFTLEAYGDQQKVDELLQDRLRADISRQLYVFGEFFDSWYCSEDTRRAVVERFSRTWPENDESGFAARDVFTAFDTGFIRALTGPTAKPTTACLNLVLLSGLPENAGGICDDPSGGTEELLHRIRQQTSAQGAAALTGLNLAESNPLVIWSNGMGAPAIVYNGLRRHIAQAGYNVVMGDGIVGIADFQGSRMVDAWNRHGKPDVVGFIGHSKGGAASVNASQRINAGREAVVSLMGATILAQGRIAAPFFGITATRGHWGDMIEGQQHPYNRATGPAAHATMNTTHSVAAVSLICQWIARDQCRTVRESAIAWFDCHLKGSCAPFVDACRSRTGFADLFLECDMKNMDSVTPCTAIDAATCPGSPAPAPECTAVDRAWCAVNGSWDPNCRKKCPHLYD